MAIHRIHKSTREWQNGRMTAPKRKLAARVGLVLLIAVPFVAVGFRVAPWVARAYAAEVHSTRGVVKSFGPDRKFVNIAHEKIDGYMMAMTMSFEPRTATQLDGIQVGDTLVFSFTETEDGRRLLNSVKKQ